MEYGRSLTHPLAIIEGKLHVHVCVKVLLISFTKHYSLEITLVRGLMAHLDRRQYTRPLYFDFQHLDDFPVLHVQHDGTITCK